MKLNPSRLFSCCTPLLLIGILTQCSTPENSNSADAFPKPSRVAKPTLKALPRLTEPASTGIIQPGDRIELFLDEDPSFNGLYVVRSEGHILVPKVGRIQVAGKSRNEAEQSIRQRFEATQVRTATLYVELIAERSNTAQANLPDLSSQLFPANGISDGFTPDSFHLAGRVNKPGNYTIPQKYLNRFGIYEAILLHGGVANFGDSTKIELMRYDADGQLSRRIVNLKKIKAGQEENLLIGDGDIIHVPEKIFGF